MVTAALSELDFVGEGFAIAQYERYMSRRHRALFEPEGRNIMSFDQTAEGELRR